MPARGTISVETLPGLIRLWMLDNPGPHRARDVANGLGKPADMPQAQWSHKVANALARETRAGKIVREYQQLEGWLKPVGTYRLPKDND